MSEISDEVKKDCEGLVYLRWSLFDSKDSVGSGYRFMEKEPVRILDEVIRLTKSRWIANNIILGYTSKPIADKLRLATTSPHRTGHAVRIRVVGSEKRGKIVKALHTLGVRRIGIAKDFVYFDTDLTLKPMLSLM